MLMRDEATAGDLESAERAVGSPGLLRFMTCGSVDDGKSTLIGRLLYDTQQILEDQLHSLRQDSKRSGTTGGDLDLALLVDGLEMERQQGITIDVAYRYFRTPRRSFIVADTPGHEQYTRNMATGASNSDLAVLLIDARKGVLVQTKRHAYICSLLGIRHLMLAINKIDLVGFEEEVYEHIVADFMAFAAPLGLGAPVAVPISARDGDNVTALSARTPWYKGPTLIEHLETVDAETSTAGLAFRFPIQRASRPNQDFRGFAGTVASGSIEAGAAVVSAVSGRTSTVSRIVTADGDLERASAGDAVTLVLADELDVARGDVLAAAADRPEVTDQFAAYVIWMSEESLFPGRSYLLRIGCRWVPASITTLKYKVDVNTLQHLAARDLHLNEIAFCNINTATPVAFDAYEANRETGAFILVDRISNATVAAGMISFGLRRATNIHVEQMFVGREARANAKHQKPTVIWFTGLSGSGKSTLAKRLEKRLHESGNHTYVLDGDNVRHGLNRDLGFTDVDRVENIRRIGEVAKLMADAGLIVLCSFISPFRAERRLVRELLDNGEFVEVFVDASLDACRRRDPKGLYAKADAGKIKNFTGIDSPYETPEAAEVHLVTEDSDPDHLVDQLIGYLRQAGRI